MTRLTPEREAEIRDLHGGRAAGVPLVTIPSEAWPWYVALGDALVEIDALRAEAHTDIDRRALFKPGARVMARISPGSQPCFGPYTVASIERGLPTLIYKLRQDDMPGQTSAPEHLLVLLTPEQDAVETELRHRLHEDAARVAATMHPRDRVVPGRLTPEREAEIRDTYRYERGPHKTAVYDLLDELDALRSELADTAEHLDALRARMRERDDAAVGRAAADRLDGIDARLAALERRDDGVIIWPAQPPPPDSRPEIVRTTGDGVWAEKRAGPWTLSGPDRWTRSAFPGYAVAKAEVYDQGWRGSARGAQDAPWAHWLASTLDRARADADAHLAVSGWTLEGAINPGATLDGEG